MGLIGEALARIISGKAQSDQAHDSAMLKLLRRDTAPPKPTAREIIERQRNRDSK